MTCTSAAALVASLDLNLQLMKLLAVAGGAALGYLLVGGVLRLVGRFFLVDKVPRTIHVAVRLLGGFTTGLLVWMWLFGVGGAGGWGSGGGGFFPFGGSGSGSGGTTTTEPAKKVIAPKEPVRGAAIQVELLGGTNVKDQRFYRIEGEDNAISFDDLKKAVEERRQKNPTIKVLRLVLRQESVDADNPAVTQLVKWARDNGLTPDLSTP